MELSLGVFGTDQTTYVDLAIACDEAGVEVLWLSDHLLTPSTFAAEYPYSDTGLPGYDTSTTLNDVWVTIGHLAAVTSRLRFSPGVFILPLRSPFVTALSLATASRLSHGRVLLGVGAGWMREEFEYVGEDFDTRGPRFDECLDVIEGLLSGAEFEHHGRFFDFAPAAIGGDPVPPVPTVFGGSTPAAVRRVVRRGDGWFGPFCPLEESLEVTARLDALRADSPRAGEPLTHYVRLVGPPTAETLARYRDAGVEHVVVSGGPLFVGMDSAQERADTIGVLTQAAHQLG
jgi:probable F420-dependent oxidoreductase